MLCRRTRVAEVSAIVHALAGQLPRVRFHLFGVKVLLLLSTDLPASVASTDSAAWNSRFGRDLAAFSQAQRERGWSQARTEIHWALPRYAAKVEHALARPKQLSLVPAE